VVDVAPPGSKKRDQRRGSGYATKAEAVAAAAELQVSKAHGSYVEPSKRTLGQYLEAWLVAGCGGHIRGSTLRHYRQAIDLHIVPRIGHLPLQGLTRLDIKAWCEELRRTGNKRTAGGPLSPKSVHDYFIALRAALEDARLDGLIRTNPAAGVYTLPRHHRPEMLTWTVEELRAFLTYAAHHRDYPLWRTAAQTGMRQGELLGLRWRDLDLDGARAHIRQQWTRQEAALEFGRPKTAAGERTIDLDPGTVEVLRQHMTAQEFERRSWGPAYAELGLVFARPDGSANDPDVVRNRFDRCFTRKVGKAPVPRIRWHDLRHTHATLLIEAGIDVRTVSERLGHSSVNVTLDLYHHVTSKSRQSAATKIGALVDGPGIGDPVVTPGSAARASG
jgi:integrase